MNNPLSAIIRQHIESAGGSISFADFMQLALYHPELGYYMQKNFQLGKRGDFTTAPELSPLFAMTLARFAKSISAKNWLELGAGSGQFALDILNEFQKQNININYTIFEISPALRELQKTRLKGFDNVIWLEKLPQHFNGVIFGNEVLDALPVNLLEIQNNQAYERRVTCVDSNFVWDNSQKILFEKIKPYDLPEGYKTEIHSTLTGFLQQVNDCLDSGVMLFIDYGYGEEEYYHPQRNAGTLNCFYQHQSHNQALLNPGLQDITAHVNFTQVVETLVTNETHLSGFTTLAGFLFDLGITEIAGDYLAQLSESEQLSARNSIKILTLPQEMGEVIKVIALQKRSNIKLPGFGLLDRRRDL